MIDSRKPAGKSPPSHFTLGPTENLKRNGNTSPTTATASKRRAIQRQPIATQPQLDTLTDGPAFRCLADIEIVEGGQKKTALSVAKGYWEKNTPLIFGASRLNSARTSFILTDGQQEITEYQKWIAAKWWGEGELTEERFTSSTHFYLGLSANDPLIRLGTISDLEEMGIGHSWTHELLNNSYWNVRSMSNEKRVLLHFLIQQKTIHCPSSIDPSSLLTGFSEEQIRSISHSIFFGVAADNTPDGHLPLIKMFLDAGLNPHDKPHPDDESPLEMAIMNDHDEAVNMIKTYDVKKKT